MQSGALTSPCKMPQSHVGMSRVTASGSLHKVMVLVLALDWQQCGFEPSARRDVSFHLQLANPHSGSFRCMVSVVKMGNIARRIGIEPTSPAIYASVLTITPPSLPVVTILCYVPLCPAPSNIFEVNPLK